MKGGGLFAAAGAALVFANALSSPALCGVFKLKPNDFARVSQNATSPASH